MNTPIATFNTDPAAAAARQCLYRTLSLAVSDPRSRRWRALLDDGWQQSAILAADLLRETAASKAIELAPGELPPARLNLRPLVAMLDGRTDRLTKEYERVFGLASPTQCPPYETDYCPLKLEVYRAHQMADVAGFYRAFALQRSRDTPERPDHLALELEFMAALIARECNAAQRGAGEQAEICREAQLAFFRDHLAWWVPAFALALRVQADGCTSREDHAADPLTFHGAAGSALAALVALERAAFALPSGQQLPAVPQMADPESFSCDQCVFAR